MKTLYLVFLITFLSITSYSQTNNSLVFGNALGKYQKMEKAGTVLTVLGGAALFTGNYLYWKAYNHRDIEEPSVSKASKYRNIMFGGLGLMAVGIPLWSYGRFKERHITIEARIVKFDGFISASGAGLKVRF